MSFVHDTALYETGRPVSRTKETYFMCKRDLHHTLKRPVTTGPISFFMCVLAAVAAAAAAAAAACVRVASS